jgi:hypothetical protein
VQLTKNFRELLPCQPRLNTQSEHGRLDAAPRVKDRKLRRFILG